MGYETLGIVPMSLLEKSVLCMFHSASCQSLVYAGVEIVTYKVIYDLVDEMRARMEGRLASVDERLDIGEAEVRAIFGSSKGKVAGCLVTDGYLRRDCIVDVRAPHLPSPLSELCVSGRP